MRRGDILTWVTIAYDPLYLTEPMIRSSEYRLVLGMQIPPYPCTVVEEVDRPQGVVPSYLPNANPFLTEWGEKYNIPLEATQGGAATMYPELARKIDLAANKAKAARLHFGHESPSNEIPQEQVLKKITRRWAFAGLACAAAAGIAGIGLAQQNRTASLRNEPSAIEIVPIRGNIYLLAGAGSNITLSVGADGVLLVDSGAAEVADKTLAAIQRLGRELTTFAQAREEERRRRRVRRSAHQQCCLPSPFASSSIPVRFPNTPAATSNLAEAGKTFTGGNVAGDLGDVGEGAAVLSHENALQRLSDAKMPIRGQPTETYFGGQMKLSHHFNGEGVQLIHIPNAITDGDSFVMFRSSDVISAGDIFSFTSYPPIDLAQGGSIQGELAGLNRMVEMVIPEFRSEGGTYVIPGPRTHLRHRRSRLLSRHGHHHSRSHSGLDQEGHDARSGESRQAHRRLGRPLRTALRHDAG